MRPGEMKAEAKKLSMPEHVLESLSMLPRSIAGRRIDDSQNNKIGAILIESECKTEIDDALKLMEKSEVFSALCDAVAATEQLFEPLRLEGKQYLQSGPHTKWRDAIYLASSSGAVCALPLSTWTLG